MGQPHKHAEFIKAYADGATIQFRISPSDNWEDAQADDDTAPAFSKNYEYRIKPEPPKYPETSLTADDMAEISRNTPGIWRESYIAIANAAIARAIEDGQVVLVPNYVDALKFSSEPMVPAAMLEKVANAVRAAFVAQVARYSTGYSTYIDGEVDLAAIIAKVKEGK